MNIFIILIMGVLFTTYQYFTAERSLDATLNKDELKLQAELNCIKQYHNFASTKMDSPNFAEDEWGMSLKGDGPNLAHYSCSGSENIELYKYCINSAGAKILCTDTNVREHCVSTIKYKHLKQSEAYLTAQIIKAGIAIVSNGQINSKDVIYKKEMPQKEASSDIIQTIGMISCMSTEEIERKNEALNSKCGEGLYISLDEFGNILTDENGDPICTPLPTTSPCTAHEIETESTGTQAGCTNVGPIRCCPNHSLELNCKGDTEKVWKSQLRFFVCDNGSEYCSKESGTMQVQDGRNNIIKNINISNAFTSQYIESSASFVCNHISNKYIEECKDQTSSSYGYMGVENLKTNISISAINSTAYTPICRLAAKEHSNAVQNCSVCEEAEFNADQARWVCSSKTWAQMNSMANKVSYINTLAGTNDGYTEKGLKGCFSNCTNEQLTLIKSGVRNGPNWGLEWNSNTRIWNCFQCEYESAYNNTCVECEKGMENIGDFSCPDQTTQGNCAPHECSTAYQTLIDGQCYTKWCNRSLLPADGNIEINNPLTNKCPDTAPWMVYNELKSCVYCMRITPDRIE